KVVDLNYLAKTLKFIQASYDFDKFGNGFLLAELLKDKQPDMARKIETFSMAMSMNYSQAIIDSMQDIKNLNIQRPYSFFRPNHLLQTYENIKEKPRHLQELELATWHYKNKNYSNAYILLAEAIVTYECIKNNLDPSDPDVRQKAKGSLRSDPRNDNLSKISKDISKIRNRIAHNIPKGDLEKDFKVLGNYIAQVKEIISK
ncbi:MAG: hypothetical protein N3A69_05030, partial [Leptospiraceae bacterium]|nr:hypothetical protein [Leptospiraceae bacterium]